MTSKELAEAIVKLLREKQCFNQGVRRRGIGLYYWKGR